MLSDARNDLPSDVLRSWSYQRSVRGNWWRWCERLLNIKSRRSGRLDRLNLLTREGIKYSKTASQHKPKLQIQYGRPKNPSPHPEQARHSNTHRLTRFNSSQITPNAQTTAARTYTSLITPSTPNHSYRPRPSPPPMLSPLH